MSDSTHNRPAPLGGDDELLTLEEVGQALRISTETVRKLCVSGKLAFVSVGTSSSRHIRRVRRSTLRAYASNERRAAIRQEMREVMRLVGAGGEVEQRW